MSINTGSLMSTPFPLLNVINSLLPSPLCRIQGLKPDRPASSYIISQNDYQQSFLSQKASQSQKQALLNKISQLQAQLTKSSSLLQSNQSQYHQQFLLFKLQIERVRTIMREQGQTIHKQLSQFNQLQQVYKLKMQQVKHMLCKSFQDQLKQKQKQSLNTLQQVRQLYVNKISTLTQSYQKQLQQKELQIHQCNSQAMNMKISTIKQVQLLEQLNQANQQNDQLTQQVYKLRKLLQQERQHRANLIDQMGNNQQLIKMKYDQLIQTNARLHEQMASINNYITTLTSSHAESMNKVTQQFQSKNEELEMLRWKCNKLEEELDQFKNRKTQGVGNLMMLTEGYKKYQRVQGEWHAEHQTQQHNINTNNHTVNGNHFAHGNFTHPNNNNNIDDRSDTQQRISYQQIRYQTQSRIGYQQSLKKMHQMQLKIQQLSQQLYKSNTQNQLLSQKINQLKDELQDQLLHVNQLKNYLTQKDQIIQNMVHAQQQQQSGGKNVTSSLSSSAEIKQKDTLLIQKDQTISTLTRQIEQRSNQMSKMQKQIQKLTKKQLNYQTQLMAIQQSYKLKLKSKQIQLNSIDSEYSKLSTAMGSHLKQIQRRDELLRVKQQEILRLVSQIRRLQSVVSQLNVVVKLKQEQLIKFGGMLNKQVEDNRLVGGELGAIKRQYEEVGNLCRLKDKMIEEKDQEIERLRGDVQRLEKNKNRQNSIVMGKYERIDVANSGDDDPFADPFLKQYDQKQQHQNEPNKYSPSTIPNYTKPLTTTNNTNPTNTNTKQLQTRILQYEQKISQLQSIVQELKFQWGATEQNENAIFSYMKAAYIDQIKTLKTKNQQLESDMKNSGEFLQIMAKKQAMESQTLYASKSKSKSKK